MKMIGLLIFAALMPVVLFAVDPPGPLTPAAGDVVYAPHPHFRWQREADVKIDEVHQIQIARDEKFADIVCDDRLEVVSRFVPVKPLSPAKYWWRVRRGAGEWPAAVPFAVREPEHVFTVRAGSDAAAVARVLQEAATNCPAQVNFEPGEYRLALNVPRGKSLVALQHAHDLILDGHGARLVAGGTFLSVVDSQRVTIQHFTVVPDRPAHTLVRVVKKDSERGQLFVKPELGYDQDVPRFFEREGNGGSFLGCMDVAHHGRYIPGAGASARTAAIAPAPDLPGGFVINPVQPEALAKMPPGAPAVVTVYRTQWIQLERTDECTFSDVAAVSLPGAFCGGTDNSAKSYLACRMPRARPEDFFGGHSSVENGRIGPWIEGCEFECLADDGPAQQSLRMTVARADGPDAVVLKDDWTNRELQPGYRVALLNAKNDRGVSARVLAVSPGRRAVRVQLDRPLSALAAELGRAANADWNGTRLFRDAPSNEDFVYRHNRHVGGRGHGVKFNGTRALIADNHFENINGNAILPGYTSAVSGHGAHDVVVSSNTIIRCGWTPFEAHSVSALGGNIIFRGNRVSEIRDAAVAVRGCTGVTISGNEFSSSTAPAKGAWVIATDAADIHCESNRYSARTPEFKMDTKPK